MTVPDQSTEMESFIARNNAFAIAMYGALRQQPGNLFFSPFGLRAALVMAQSGARGDTEEQMRAVLRTGPADELEHAAFAAAIQQLQAGADGRYRMTMASSLWAQESTPLQHEFVDLITRHYGNAVHCLDFRTSAGTCESTINRWVAENTGQKIQDLVPPLYLDENTRLVLANAVRFEGRWLEPFARSATKPGSFHLESGKAVQVPLMHQLASFRHLRGEEYQALEIVYRGHEVSMLVLLPHQGQGLNGLEERLSMQMLHECLTGMSARLVFVDLPRFAFERGGDVRNALKALGMTRPFDQAQADFSGINGYRSPHKEALFLSAVFHKGFVDVNEEGTEAATATAGCAKVMGLGTMFFADHPFVFLIFERRTGAILFLGRLADPTRDM